MFATVNIWPWSVLRELYFKSDFKSTVVYLGGGLSWGCLPREFTANSGH